MTVHDGPQVARWASEGTSLRAGSAVALVGVDWIPCAPGLEMDDAHACLLLLLTCLWGQEVLNMSLSSQDRSYADWIEALKVTIRHARIQTSLAVNTALIGLYWRLGHEILSRQRDQGWGAKVVDQVAADLRHEFPDMKGLSRSNLNAMRAFAQAWPNPAIFQQAVGKLPWGHNTLLLTKLSSEHERAWYADQAFRHNWSRAVLLHMIETRVHERRAQALTNFASTMTSERALVATPVFKDPYVLDFVALADDAHERHLERALIERVQKLLLELGNGFAFIGAQHHIEVGGLDYFVDLLFYHTKLHSHIAVDLKMVDFVPEYAGKMNFYLGALDATLRTPGDEPSIGLILCRGKNGVVVEYTLGTMGRPMAVADYKVLPPDLADALPSPEYLMDRLGSLEDATQIETDEPATHRPS